MANRPPPPPRTSSVDASIDARARALGRGVVAGMGGARYGRWEVGSWGVGEWRSKDGRRRRQPAKTVARTVARTGLALDESILSKHNGMAGCGAWSVERGAWGGP